MKKTLLYLMVLVLTAFSAKGQDYTWQVLSNSGTGLFTALSNTYSLAYFKGGTFDVGGTPVTIGARVYVATREGGGIDVLDASTGVFVKNIPIAGTGYKNTKIRVTEAGEIYSISMRTAGAVSSDGISLTVNYLANELSTVVPLSFAYPAGMASYPRMGDSFDVVGSGANAVFFVGGSTSSFVYVYKRNGNAVDLVRSVNIGGDFAAYSISVLPNQTNLSNSDFFVSHNTTSTARKLFKYDSGNGTYAAVTLPTKIHDASVANNFSQIKYFSVAGQAYLATTGGSTDPSSKNIKIFKVIGADYSVNTSFELVRTLSGGSYTYVTGNSGFSDLSLSKSAVETGDFSNGKFELELYQLVTRNAISKYKLEFNADGTLPVSLTSFEASLKNGQSTLSWQTTSESNNKGFEIQRSVDGKEFIAIAFENTKATNGNSSSVLDYTFVDKTAFSGTNYYRLKQIDLDGNSNMYDVKAVNVDVRSADVQVYPNPVTSYVKIKVANYEGLEYKLYDVAGKVIITAKANQEETELSTLGLSPSFYILKITKGTEELKAIKIIKH